MIVVEGSFDPITETELTALKQLHHQYQEDIFVQLKEEGVLDLAERMILVEHAVLPYRHLQLIAEYTGSTIDFSQYREEEKEVRSGMFRKAAYGIRKYIFEKGLYFKETAEAMCNPHRYQHSLRVAETARKIAMHQNVDPDTAYKAGLLHDITKAMSHEEGEKILAKYRPSWVSYSDKIWHSFTAVIWMKQNMAFYDEEILNAIEHHTLGDSRSKLALIIYIADKIEPGRGYDTTKHMELAYTDLQACSALIHKESIEYRKNREGVHE
jgi:nicotinate-nucleotide adenylyltransferase